MFILFWMTLLLTVTDISSSSDLSANPTLMIPSLTEGEEATLTCTAPVTCSDPKSYPELILIWVNTGENNSYTAGNKTKARRPNSTLTFNPSAKHHGTVVTCRVTCSNHTSAEVTVTLNVTYVKKPEISGKTKLMDGDTLNLTCTADSFPQSVIKWTKHGINKTLSNQTGLDSGTSALIISNMTAEDSGLYFCTVKNMTQNISITVINQKRLKITGEKDVTEGRALNLTCSFDTFLPSLITWTKLGFNTTVSNGTGVATLFISNTTAEQSGCYVCTAEHLNSTLTAEVDVKIKYQRSLKIIGETSVTEGGVLKLTCSVDSWPLSFITWTKLGFNTTLKNGTGAALLLIYNVTAEHSVPYICTAKHLDNTLMEGVNITVRLQPRILKESECEAQQDILTCVCISQGIPLPNIKWLLLENQTEYSFNTAVSNHTVKSTLILNVAEHHWDPAVCVSSNKNGETKRSLIVKQVTEEGQITKMFRSVTQLGTIIPFLTGILLSALIFCLSLLCCRKTQKAKGSDTLEMMTNQESSLTNGGQGMEYEQIQAEGMAGGADGAEAGSSDVEYSDIKLLMWKKNISTGKKWKKQETADTEYAKIKPQANEEGKEEEELKLYLQEVAGFEDAAVYSTVTELMD